MRSIVVGTAAMFLAVGAHVPARAVFVPDVSHYMVIIATPTSGAAISVQMTTLTFPSERACVAAAEVFGQSTATVNVVARCAAQK